jgi:hypothetical protein
MIEQKRKPTIRATDLLRLEDLAFLQHLHSLTAGNPVKPDKEDFDFTVPARTADEQAEQYRQAQARKLLRVYSEWKAKQK